MYVKFKSLISWAFVFFFTVEIACAQNPEKVEIWPNLAPGEMVREPEVNDPNVPNAPALKVTTPYLLIQRPKKQTSDVCVLIMPGGGFNVCFYNNEGFPPSKYWNDRGYVTAILVYRVPRPASGNDSFLDRRGCRGGKKIRSEFYNC